MNELNQAKPALVAAALGLLNAVVVSVVFAAAPVQGLERSAFCVMQRAAYS